MFPPINAFHDPGGEALFGAHPGYIVFTVNVRETSRLNLESYVQQGITPIVRLNWGYYPDGTIPLPSEYDRFTDLCLELIDWSLGCDLWILGNEPNHPVEWPGDEPIMYYQYAKCYIQMWNKLNNIGRAEYQTRKDRLLVAPIAPWSMNETGSAYDYMRLMLHAILGDGICPEGIALHTYTHGQDPALITSEQRMNPPFEFKRYEFRAYRDMIACIPPELIGTPLYITETNPGAHAISDEIEGWQDSNTGWVQEAHKEIDRWNLANPLWNIRCLALYRWPHYDRWWMEGKGALADDIRAAFALNIRPHMEPEPDDEEKPPMAWTKIADDRFNGAYPARDDPYTGEQNCSELEVPQGWQFSWKWDNVEPGRLVRPEVKERPPSSPSSLEGSSVGIHVTNATMDCVLWRRFPVKMGSKIRTNISVMGDADDGNAGITMGISPIGVGVESAGEWPEAIEWSDDWYAQNDGSISPWENGKWLPLNWTKDGNNEIVAQAHYVTVFVRIANAYKVNVALHVDQFELWSDMVVEDPDPDDPDDPTPDPDGTIGDIENHINSAIVSLNEAKRLLLGLTSSAILCVPVSKLES
jgi:hypothetical protein